MTPGARAVLKREFAAVRGVLMQDWNPVDVEGLPEDEYDSYVWPILGVLRAGGGREALLARLRDIELQWFGGTGCDARLAAVVDRLQALGVGKAKETPT